MRLGLAFRAFWSVLFSSEKATAIRDCLVGKSTQASIESKPTPEVVRVEGSKKVELPKRSEALTLLSVLQREARLLDLVQESLDDYSDAAVGAAARDVLRDCRKSLHRMIPLAPVMEEEEGTSVAVPSNASALRIRLTGSGAQATSGVLVHRGWMATSVQLPQWTGTDADATVLAPAEIEVR